MTDDTNIARDYRYGDNASHRQWLKWWLWTPDGAAAYLRPLAWPVNAVPKGPWSRVIA